MKLTKFVDVFHFLSFDVAIGTIIQVLAIQKFTQFSFPPDFFILLPVAVLMIYWTDRLLDVYKYSLKQLITPKHVFYKKNFLLILVFDFILTLCLIIKGLLFSSSQVYFLGLYGGIAIVVYFFLYHFLKEYSILKYLKELSVATIYTLVLWIYPLVYHFSLMNGVAFLNLFVQALLNLWIISSWDKEIDTALKVPSFAQWKKHETWIAILFVLSGAFSFVLLSLEWAYGLCFIFMTLLHFYLWLYGKHYHRVWIELVLWVPSIYYCFK